MTRMTDLQEESRGALEDSLMGLRRNTSELDLAVLRIHQAIQRNAALRDLLEPAIQIAARCKRVDSNAFQLLSDQWNEHWRGN